jgi:cytidylate kinase
MTTKKSDRIRRPIIAIDGPAGAGKSTLARRLAVALGLPYVNTGLMYRAVTGRALSAGIDPDHEGPLAEQARSIAFEMQDGDPPELTIDGQAEYEALMSAAVEEHVSRFARHPAVRSVLRERQRVLGAEGSVMEGRDIGSVVFPDADVKIFLSGEPNVRAGRRGREEGRGEDASRAVHSRDAADALTNPFTPASDAHVIDTTGLSPDEVFARVMTIVRSQLDLGGSNEGAD